MSLRKPTVGGSGSGWCIYRFSRALYIKEKTDTQASMTRWRSLLRRFWIFAVNASFVDNTGPKSGKLRGVVLTSIILTDPGGYHRAI
jgi:hypothetical protein